MRCRQRDRVEVGEDGTEVDPWNVERQVVPRRETAATVGVATAAVSASGPLRGAVAVCGNCDTCGTRAQELIPVKTGHSNGLAQSSRNAHSSWAQTARAPRSPFRD